MKLISYLAQWFTKMGKRDGASRSATNVKIGVLQRGAMVMSSVMLFVALHTHNTRSFDSHGPATEGIDATLGIQRLYKPYGTKGYFQNCSYPQTCLPMS